LKILVVDDSKTSLLTIVTHLKQLHHEVVSTTDPTKALELYQTESPNLIILDVVMDKLSGFECAKLIRYDNTLPHWVPIIFLSAMVDDSFIEQAIESGGDDYLAKPVTSTTLKAKIAAMERIAQMQSQLKEVNIKLQQLSSTDTLTGLANRYYFEKEIKSMIANAKRNNHIFALLFIDIDHFKTINDSLGHQVGDLLLRDISKRMREIVRESDFIARLGGDEFAIILQEIDNTHSAGKIAHKLIKSLHQPYVINKNNIQVSASIGIACFPNAGKDMSTLVKNADIAMYRAKSAGRNNYQYFTDKLNVEHQEKSSIEIALSHSISNHELFLLYQPEYSLQSHDIIGMEALIRWQHDTLGIISPDKFISIAEENGFIIKLGDWILESVCKQYQSWLKEYHIDIPVAINLSPQQILKSDIAGRIKALLEQYSIPAHRIQFEITETTIMGHSGIVETTLKEFNKMGIKLYIDDFGTGYSSLSHLKLLPIDALKIDKEFVMDLAHDENDAAIVKSVISLSNALGLDVVAEGIETQQQLEFLIQHGCLKGQGYYFSKPLTPEDIIKLLTQNN